MLEELIAIGINALTFVFILGGLFFMLVGAIGVVRLPDFYARSSAASKCVTLGTSGLLLGMTLFLTIGTDISATDISDDVVSELEVSVGTEQSVPAATIKALLVLAFVFVASPVGSHMLARAAHLARAPMWRGTISDELADDRGETMVLEGDDETDGAKDDDRG